MTSKQADLDLEVCGNRAKAGVRKEQSMAAEESVRTEEQAFYEAQEQGFAALRARNESRTRRKP